MKTADVAALVFELQRTRSPVERARVLARAWRTIRGLDAVERRLLAREVGFDGAEELLERLARRGAGGLAPAALLEALGRARRDDGLSVKALVDAIGDPQRRDELVEEGLDVAAGLVDDGGGPAAPGASVPPAAAKEALPATQPTRVSAAVDDRGPGSGAEPNAASPLRPGTRPQQPRPAAVDSPRVTETEQVDGVPESAPPADRGRAGLERPPPGRATARAAAAEEIATAERSPWDRLSSPWTQPAAAEVQPPSSARQVSSPSSDDAGTVLERISRLRTSIPELRRASPPELAAALSLFPEPWARRRVIAALIEAGVPDDPADAVGLIESSLERPLDRRWCLAALACRGDLAGEALSRALELLVSPGARRRVAALARAAASRAPTRAPAAS